MRFEIGKCYKHSSGEVMRILACIDITIYGRTLIAERGEGYNFQAVGFDTNGYAENSEEIDKEEWPIYFPTTQEQNNDHVSEEENKKPTDELEIYRRGYREGQLDLMMELK